MVGCLMKWGYPSVGVGVRASTLELGHYLDVHVPL